MIRPEKHIPLLLLFLMVLSATGIAPQSVRGQSADSETFSFDFRGEPLQNVLETIARVTKTDMMYDPNMIGDEVIYKRIREQPMPGLLSDLLADTRFDYIVLSSGTTVIVRKVSEEPAFGTLSGKVRDSRTGKPLYGATVLLADASGGTSTNINGDFTIGKMMSGSYRIVISYVGYEPVEKVIEIRPDEMARTEILLDPGTLSFTPVLIRTHRPNLAGIDRRSSLRSMSSLDIAGSGHDAIRSLSLFPGLQYGLPMQDIHLQGGRQGEHRIRLDGIPVYNPYHFGHIYSAFSPVAIGDVQLHKAGFGAEQGSMIAGIIDFQHDIPNKNEDRLMMLGDPVNVNVRGNLILPAGSSLASASGTPGEASGAMTATFRTNLWDMYQDPALLRTLRDWDFVDPVLSNHFLNPHWDVSEYQPVSQDLDIRYYDGHFAARFEPNAFHTIQTSLYYGQNSITASHLGEGIAGPVSSNFLYALDTFEGSHVSGQLTWSTRPASRMDLSTQIGLSTNRMDHLYHLETRDFARSGTAGDFSTEALRSSFSDNVDQLPSHVGNNRIDHGVIRSDLTYSLSPETRVESGLEFNLVSSKVDFSDFFYQPVHAEEKSSYGAIYANLNRQFGHYWQATIGSRLTRTDSRSDIYPEPRFSLQYDRPESRIGYWTGRISGGMYRQFVNQYEITNAGPTAMIPSLTVWSHALTSEPPKAYHLSGSWITRPVDRTWITLESYYKWEPSGYVSSPMHLLGYAGVDRSTVAAFSESTRLRSWGGSARIRHHLADARGKLILGYDYSHAELEVSQFGRVLPASWNEPHRIQARSILRIYGPVSVIANWKSIYGRTWGFRQAYYDYLYPEGVQEIGGYTFATPENDRLRPFHQLDLSLMYQPEIGSVKLDLRLDLINVLNRRNVIDWSLQPVPGQGDGEVVSGQGQSAQVGTGQSASNKMAPAGGSIATNGSLRPDGGLRPDDLMTADKSRTEYSIRERTMPGFYYTFRIEITF